MKASCLEVDNGTMIILCSEHGQSETEPAGQFNRLRKIPKDPDKQPTRQRRMVTFYIVTINDLFLDIKCDN